MDTWWERRRWASMLGAALLVAGAVAGGQLAVGAALGAEPGAAFGPLPAGDVAARTALSPYRDGAFTVRAAAVDARVDIASAEDGSYVLGHTPAGSDVVLDLGLLAGEDARPWWVEPSSGRTVQLADLVSDGVARFPVPEGGGTAWVLLVDDVGAGYGAPDAGAIAETVRSALDGTGDGSGGDVDGSPDGGADGSPDGGADTPVGDRTGSGSSGGRESEGEATGSGGADRSDGERTRDDGSIGDGRSRADDENGGSAEDGGEKGPGSDQRDGSAGDDTGSDRKPDSGDDASAGDAPASGTSPEDREFPAEPERPEQEEPATQEPVTQEPATQELPEPEKPPEQKQTAADPAWDRLADCESSGDWAISTGNGYHGGLQFDEATWSDFGGTAYAPTADGATKDQQIEVATKVRDARGGYGSWPACARKLDLPR